MHRYVITGALVCDGMNGAPLIKDVAIESGVISTVGENLSKEGARLIDGTGLVLAPGFIDVHTHADVEVFERVSDEIKLRQGVTSIIVGNCGFSCAPMNRQYGERTRTYLSTIMDGSKAGEYESFSEYMETLIGQKLGLNVGALCGNGAVRIAANGFGAGRLSPENMSAAKAMIREAMEAGALGLSFGLMYAPENYYSRNELSELASVIAPYNGVLVTHIRGEANSLVSSVREVIDIAKTAGVRLHISHFKAAGKNNWGHSLGLAMSEIEKAIAGGMVITCDAYCYNAGSTMLTTLFPPWTMEGGIEEFIRRLKDPVLRAGIAAEVNSEQAEWDNIVFSTGWDAVTITSAQKRANRHVIGKTIGQLARDADMEPVEYAMDLILSEGANVLMVFEHMSEDDVAAALSWRYCGLASDSIYSGDMPHPRLYGTFPRFYDRFVKTGKMPLETAVYKCTGFMADAFSLNGIGKILTGYRADITLFDLGAMQDTATYLKPKSYGEGVTHVFIGGRPAIMDGVKTENYNGIVLARS